MKNKYDIIKKRYNKLARWGLRQVPGTLCLAIKTMKASNSNSLEERKKYELSIVKFMQKMLPKAEETDHLLYENIKDIDKMSSGELMIRLEKQGINDIASFSLNYNEKRKKVIKGLYAFAILKENNIDLTCDNHEFVNCIISGQSPMDAYINQFKNLGENIYQLDLCDEVFNGNIYDLPQDVFQKIEAYHNKYMQENIYGNLINNEYTEEDVLDFSEKAFKK